MMLCYYKKILVICYRYLPCYQICHILFKCNMKNDLTYMFCEFVSISSHLNEWSE